MIQSRKIELLAPAKNLECGIEAINHGADAVYIGAPKFSARSSAGNTLNDIEQLVKYAHQYGVKIYVALNTILKDEELAETEQLLWDLYKMEVDAVIIQDMGVTQLNLPPIALHASTQTDNRSPEKVKFLENAGFSQIVLARELSIGQIKEIAQQVSTPLEAFVHGALCVCYSGQCYLSEAITQRSANRGACAQLCRLPYTLLDSEGETVVAKKHLLSMKDLNLSDQLEELLDAGVSSLKIEGRLKDMSYVKNVVTYYRKKLDEILQRRPGLVRSSSGKSTYTFEPNLEKSFNRGYTEYFINERNNQDIWSIDTPKSVGEPIGEVKNVSDRFFILSSDSRKLNNGDGLCFVDEKGDLQGVRVNKVEDGKIYPAEKNSGIKKGVLMYRNFDHEFEKVLSKKSAERKVDAVITLTDSADGFDIHINDENGYNTSISIICEKEIAQKNQTDNLINNLSKTGNTIFTISKVEINLSENWFIPSSQVSDWRRQLTEQLLDVRQQAYKPVDTSLKVSSHKFPVAELTYLGNVMNRKSVDFYKQHGSLVKELAFEKQKQESVPLMFTRHCIKYSLGWCPKEKKEKHPYKEPFYLLYNNTRLRLNFDCVKCEMIVIQDR